jgi:hypothetical protein
MNDSEAPSVVTQPTDGVFICGPAFGIFYSCPFFSPHSIHR